MPYPLPDIDRSQIKHCKFAFIKTDIFDPLGSASLKLAWEKAKESLIQAGATIEEIELGPEFDGWEGVGGQCEKIVNGPASVSFLREYTLDPDRVSKSIAHRVNSDAPSKAVARLYDELAALRPKFDQIAQQYDAIITPSTTDEAPKKLEKDTIEIGALWTGLHVPAVGIPGLAGVNGLPIGLTMLAPRYVARSPYR